MSKGIFFTFDGLFAALLIVSAVVLLLTFTEQHTERNSLQQSTADTLVVLNTLTVDELDPTMATAVKATNLTNGNDTVIEALGALWAANHTLQSNFSSYILTLFPQNHALAFYANGEQLAIRATTTQANAHRVASTKQPVSGIAPGKPLSGSTATAFLRRVENKTTNSFAYFGGFVGQGNVTTNLLLPTDVTSARVLELRAELDTPSSFTLRVNDQSCGAYTPTAFNMTPTQWNLVNCTQYLVPGNNSFTFIYQNLTTAYIAGGYVRALYTSDIVSTNTNYTGTTYQFPRIEGVVNLYDGILVPSSMRNVTVFLHYHTSDPTVLTYLAIGEKTVWSSNQTGEVRVTLTDTNLTLLGLDYAALSNKTVPIRFSSFNSTQTVVTSGNADVVLITDYSASMKKDIDSWDTGNAGNIDNCEGAVYPDDDIRRTHLARCLDKEVVSILLNYTGNRLWPVHYVDNTVYWYNNPQDNQSITGFYNTFTATFPQQGRDKTCVACALSKAYEIFAAYPQQNRTRAIILMSDGLPTHCTGAGCSGLNTTYGSQICEGFCDENGNNCNNFANMCTDSTCGAAIDNAATVAQRLVTDFNVTIYTVGFGPVSSCANATQLLQRIATMSNGTYQSSDDPQALKLIYRNISQSILQQVALEAQTLQVPSNISYALLENDSFISITHDALPAPPLNMIEVTRQTTQFGSCTPSIQLPSQLVYTEGVIVSYSGPHWTDRLVVNGIPVHNLSDFYAPYYRLGDPYRLHVPSTLLTPITNLFIGTGDSAVNTTGCSQNNSLIYTAFVPSATPRTAVLENATGCVWTIEKDSGGVQVVAIPATYTGTNVCAYTNADIAYDSGDALQQAVYEILRELDFDDDGRIFVSLSEENLEIIVTKISSVPYLWGPSIVEVRAWQ
jgi:hypothetical protein